MEHECFSLNTVDENSKFIFVVSSLVVDSGLMGGVGHSWERQRVHITKLGVNFIRPFKIIDIAIIIVCC